MTGEGRVYDLGYAPHDGIRLGRAGAVRAILKDGLRRAMGIRRKARSKILPWALTAAAVVPAVVLVALSFLLAGFQLPDGGAFASHARYFDLIGALSMLFVAFVAPTLLIPDRVHGVLSIYASRPVRVSDYLLARAGALAVLTSLFILVPHALLYVGIAALNPEGLVPGLLANIAEIPPILGSTLGFVIGFGSLAFLISTFMKRVATATGVFVVVMFLTEGVTEVIAEVTENVLLRYIAPISIMSDAGAVRDWFFGVEGRSALARVGLPDWVGAVALLAFAAGTAFVVHRRYRREL